MPLSLEAKFQGCLLGLAVGDALGALFEGQPASFMQARFGTTERILDVAKDKLYYTEETALYYTDDTQMAIGVAETLVQAGEIVESELCKAFVANYMPNRGYGRGARAVLEAMEDGKDYRAVANSYFPGGSYGNGAAMRVAPVGLLFQQDLPTLLDQAHASAFPTHTHPLGIEGAQLIALAVALASQSAGFDRVEFFATLTAHCQTDEFTRKLQQAVSVDSFEDFANLGNGITATESVVTAIACFALTPDSFGTTIGNAILLGGDTDTIAAMAGAISGAYLGLAAIPEHLLEKLEDVEKGRSYLLDLAAKLHQRAVSASRS